MPSLIQIAPAAGGEFSPLCQTDGIMLLPGNKQVQVHVTNETFPKFLELAASMAVHRFRAPIEGADMSFSASVSKVLTGSPWIELQIVGPMRRN